MANQILIKAKKREDKKNKALRREGYVPATIYGHNFESKSVQVVARDFSKIPHKAYSHVNQLDVDGDQKYDVLIKNVQQDPVKDTFLNVEFYRINPNEKVKIKVSLNFAGHSAAVALGGVLIVSYDEIEIQCLPKNIPDQIEVNMEDLKEVGNSIHVRDLKLPDGVVPLLRPTEVIVRVEAPKTQVVDEKPAEATAAATPAAGTAEPAKGAEAAKGAKPEAKK